MNRNIEIQINQICLEGISGTDKRMVERAVLQHLHQLLSETTLRTGGSPLQRINQVEHSPVKVAQGTQDHDLGKGIAAAVVSALTNI